MEDTVGPGSSGGWGRGGFSLLEALVAVTLATVLITLVASVFVAQNRFFQGTVARSDVQDRVRSVAEQIRSEFRAVTLDGVEVAEPDRIVLRTPITIGIVCDYDEPSGKGKGKGSGATGSVSVYLPREEALFDEDRVTGYGVRDEGGTWSYFGNGWGDIVGSGGNPRADCEEAGDDGTGDDAEYLTLDGSVAQNLDGSGLISLITRLEFTLDESQLRPGELALFRAVGDGASVEFATGMAEDARFQYRVGDSDEWQDQVNPPPQRRNIRAVRMVAEARSPDGAGGEVQHGWVVEIPFRNAP